MENTRSYNAWLIRLGEKAKFDSYILSIDDNHSDIQSIQQEFFELT